MRLGNVSDKVRPLGDFLTRSVEEHGEETFFICDGEAYSYWSIDEHVIVIEV